LIVDGRQCEERTGREGVDGDAAWPDPFSLYLHIPYCLSKCPYCDFNSHAVSRWPEAEYADALIVELETYAQRPSWTGSSVRTIFFGGGTPSLFAPATIGRVLQRIARLWPVDLPEIEVTLEANPGTVTLDTLCGFRGAGINRISFGVQSFDARHLARLGRAHDADQALAALRNARAAGFDNVNLDLIFAVPGQTLAEWEADLETALALAPDHISAYNLTFEEGTAFHAMRERGEIVPQHEELEAAMFTRTREVLGARGYDAYEISNFAAPGRACRHNLNYWRAGAYLGVGAGAHSFASRPVPGVRWSNERGPNAYLARVRADGHARAAEERLSAGQARGEFVFLGLRCRDGIDARDFAARFSVELEDAFPHGAALHRDGLLERDGPRWMLSARGLLVADSVFATFL